MKKRLRLLDDGQGRSVVNCRKLFADEEAIETSPHQRFALCPEGRRKLFADEEAIETLPG